MAVDLVKIALGLLALPTVLWIITYFGKCESHVHLAPIASEDMLSVAIRRSLWARPQGQCSS